MMNQPPPGLPNPHGPLGLFLSLPLLLYRIGLGRSMRIVPFMILTTRGRKSGLPRHVMLEYRRHGNKIYAVSGWGTQPHWYKNLAANPQVTVQLGTRDLYATATTVTNTAEAFRALYMFRRKSPIYAAIFARMSTAEKVSATTLADISDEFTVIRFDLDTSEVPPLRGIRPVNTWVGPVMATSGVFMTVFWAWRIKSIFRQSLSETSEAD